jgi:radical SAM-linked protein
MRLEPRFLATEYKRAMQGKLSPPCGKPVGAQVHHTNLEQHEADKRILVCYHCGVACDMTHMREERGAFLEKLGAFTPGARAMETRVAVETISIDADAHSPTLPKNGNGRPPHNFNQGMPHRYRLRYAKTGVAALTGHLDFIRALPRVMRRAGLMPYYSEGFHPKPVMEFSPPLPLGMAGYDEAVEIVLTEAIDPRVLVERLNAAAPEGLTFTDAEARPSGSPRLSKDLVAAEYLVRVDAGGDDMDAAPDHYLARESDLREVSRKDGMRTIDLRLAVLEARWMNGDQVPEGFARNGSRYLWMRFPLNHGVHARPHEVAAAVLGDGVPIDLPRLARLRLEIAR